MHYRFAATKENIELSIIKFLQDNNRSVSLKKENDYKGISFSFVWERLTESDFKFICYQKGIFSIIAPEFKEALENQPFGILNSLFYKELFSFSYTTDSNTKLKDTVYTDLLLFKFIELFEDEETMLAYVCECFNRFGWQLQTKEEEALDWKDYIE